MDIERLEMMYHEFSRDEREDYFNKIRFLNYIDGGSIDIIIEMFLLIGIGLEKTNTRIII